MRKLIFYLMVFNCILCKAQNFRCGDYYTAVEEFKKAKSSNLNKYATRLKEQGYYDKSTGIRYLFRIEHNDVDSVVLCDYAQRWFAKRTNKQIEDVVRSFKEKGAFTSEEHLNIYDATVFWKKTNASVSAEIAVIVAVKNGFFDIGVICPCYTTTFHNKTLRDLLKDREFEHYTNRVMDVFPFKSTNLDKMYATAYVYASGKCLDIIGEFLDYLNQQ